jgi:hypothetical protein
MILHTWVYWDVGPKLTAGISGTAPSTRGVLATVRPIEARRCATPVPAVRPPDTPEVQCVVDATASGKLVTDVPSCYR